MKLVYVAGPYRSKHGVYATKINIQTAERVGMDVIKMGAYPIIPHANTAFFEGIASDDFFIEGTKEALRRCDAMLVCPNWQKSEGTLGEIKEANKLKIPVFYWPDDLSILQFTLK